MNSLALQNVSNVSTTSYTGFRLHVDGLTTDVGGYLALIEARWAAEGDRPPLDVTSASQQPSVVTIAIEPRCTMHVRVEDDALVEMWINPGRPGTLADGARGDP